MVDFALFTCYFVLMPKSIGEKERQEIALGLEKLGLKEKEALVYVALLELGEVGSSRIAAKTGLHTQFIYLALESLEKHGLAQHVIRRGRKKFSGKHPQALVRLVEQQKKTADALASRLEQFISLPKEQRFEVFQGNTSYVAHEFDILRETPDASEIMIISGSGDRFDHEMKNVMTEYEALRIKKKVSLRYLGSRAEREYLESTALTRTLFAYRLLPGLFTGQISTVIGPSTISFKVYGEPVTSFVVSNEVIAGSYKQFFETLWNMASS